MKDDLISLPLHIPPDALVLDVGSGHKPHPRADVLCDKFLDDNAERGFDLVVDRPLVAGDVQNLPFRSDAFDFIITRHILEHVESPDAFFTEIQRVAPAGYIETPTIIWEHLHPVRTYHHWLLVMLDDTIHMTPKPAEMHTSVMGLTMEEMGQNSLEYGLMIKAYKDLFYLRRQWQRPLTYQLHPSPETAPPWLSQPWSGDMARRWIPPRAAGPKIIGLAQTLTETAVYLLTQPLNRRRNHRALRQRQQQQPVQLANLLQCPTCHATDITLANQTANCSRCGWQTAVLLPTP
ncbi:MAG: methyltransferase domain-containing protein [Candidatus Promineifilaceae bacterium]|nr:methyltransferase domain-containing protein [Chloroflexota bacterium]